MTEKAGGLRIKKIVENEGIDPNETITRFFEYKDENDPESSSGVIFQKPRYYYNTYRKIFVECHPDAEESCTPYYTTGEFLSGISSNTTNLGTTNGSHVSYRHVTEYFGESGEFGKTTHKFTSPYDYLDEIFDSFPFAPAISNDFNRGILKEQKHYKYNNGNYYKVHEIVNEFESIHREIPSLKAGVQIAGASNAPKTPSTYKAQEYSLKFGHYRVNQTQETTFHPTGNVTTTTIKNYDANLHYLESTEFVDSKGQTYINEIYYPKDFTGYNIADAMINNHQLNAPIEQIQRISGSSGEKYVAAIYTEYGLKYNGYMPINVFQANAMDQTFAKSTSNQGVYDQNFYDLRSSYDYDEQLNLIQVINADGSKIAYIWGYNHSVPIARVENSTYEEVKNNLTSVQLGSLNGVTPFNEERRATMEILRQNHTDAFITSYTYDLPNLDSVTDPNGNTTYYEYDKLGRLNIVRDFEHNILQTTEYFYRRD